ncbi:MAG: MarR family winged helix-turn-helix transcriptional regulator [Acidimicrobiales bacterium]
MVTRWLDQEEQATWRSFLTANQMLLNQLDRELQATSGIPHAYYEILVLLSESPGWALRMSELAQRSTSSRSRISHAVDRLENYGWVRRENCPTDKRGAIAVLSAEGFATLAKASHGHVEGVRTHLFDQLTPDQVRALRSINEAVINHLGRIADPDPGAAATP